MNKIFIGIFLVAIVVSQAVVGYAMTDREKEAQRYFEMANSEYKESIHDTKRVIANYNRAIELNPNLADAYIGLSVIYMGCAGGPRVDHDSAMLCCEYALKVDPNSARAYRWRAYLTNASDYFNIYKDRTINQALADINRAIELDPNYLDAYEVRAEIYHKMGNYSRAIEDYVYILKYPDLTNSSYMQYYDFDRVSDWQWFYKWDQRIANLLWHLSDSLYKNGNIDEAIEACELALKLSPNNGWIKRSLNGYRN